MDALAKGGVFLFEGFRLDRQARALFRRDEGGVFVPVAVGSRALDVLGVLVGRAGDLVSRDEFMRAVWPATAVEDTNLNMQIGALRRVLDAGRADGSCIQTVPGRGYRFVAPVTRVGPPALPMGRAFGDGDGAVLAETWESHSSVAPSQSRVTPPIPLAQSRKRRWGSILIPLAGALCLLGAAITVSNWHSPWFGEARPIPRLSIVVLPFTNLNDDPDQQYFADGITEDLTTDLSRIPDIFVISRNSAFTYRNKPVDTKQIGRELGVRYVLEGSIRRSGSQVRVDARLIDAASNAHLWAERFDRDTGDLFALQNEITSRLANALGVELIAAEAARPTEHSDALDYILRGRATRLKPNSRNVLAEAISLYERALSLDPESIEAQSQLANSLMSRVLDGMTDSAAADLTRAEKLVDQALAASPRYALAHFVKGDVLRARGKYQEAISEYETALSLNRNLVVALAAIGRCKIYVGPIDEGIAAQEQAMRLSPRDPFLWSWYFRIGEGHLLLSHVDDAILWLEKARNANPAPSYIHAYLASAYAIRGETERAAAEVGEARKLAGEGSYSSIAKMKAGRPSSQPDTIRALFDATYFVGLRKAGVPEE